MANEKRLIDANVVLAKQFTAGLSDASGNYYGHADVVFVNDIENAPTVDAVEVVRCKDCKSWEQYNACDGTKPHRCMNHDAIFYKRTKADDFCSYGERRTDG